MLAYMTFHPDHWTKITSTNPLERVIGQIKRRTDAPRGRPIRLPPETTMRAYTILQDTI